MKHVCVLVRTGFLCESYKYRELSFCFSFFFYKITLHADSLQRTRPSRACGHLYSRQKGPHRLCVMASACSFWVDDETRRRYCSVRSVHPSLIIKDLYFHCTRYLMNIFVAPCVRFLTSPLWSLHADLTCTPCPLHMAVHKHLRHPRAYYVHMSGFCWLCFCWRAHVFYLY